jgi:hypothetical protein
MLTPLDRALLVYVTVMVLAFLLLCAPIGGGR